MLGIHLKRIFPPRPHSLNNQFHHQRNRTCMYVRVVFVCAVRLLDCRTAVAEQCDCIPDPLVWMNVGGWYWVALALSCSACIRTNGDDTRALEILTLIFTLAPDYPLFVLLNETRHKIYSLANLLCT